MEGVIYVPKFQLLDLGLVDTEPRKRKLEGYMETGTQA